MKTITIVFLLGLIVFTGCNGNGDIKIIEGSGTIEATEIILSSKTAGDVEKIIFDEGSLVRENDTVLIINHDILDLQLLQAKASRDLAQAQLNLAQKGARSEDKSQAKEMLNQAEANYNQALADKNRMQNLYESQSITKKQWEDIQTRFMVAESQLNAATDNYKKVQNITRPDELKQVEANFNKADAAVKLSEKNIKDCYLLAPGKGVIVKVFFEKGETVMPGSSLFKFSDQSSVDLVIYVPEEKLGLVRLGQKAEIEVDAFAEKTFEGKVTYISPEAEFTPKNIQTKDERTKLVFAVKIEIPNPEFELKAGLPADAKISVN